MKIKLIGTGTMGSRTRCNTSMMVDDILFDIGMGTIKQIERLKIYKESVKYVCISHYHADHFLDIPNLLVGRRNKDEQTITFIGPKGLRNKVIELMKFTHADGDEHKYDNIEEKKNIQFCELGEHEVFEGPDFTITAIPMKHGNCKPIYGYILQKENQKIAYCCDTTLFDEFYDICEKADYMFSDATKLQTNDSHMGLEDYEKIANQYPNCKFYALHRGDYEIPQKSAVHFPMDGDEIEM